MGSNIQTATTVEAPTEAHDPSGPRLTSCATGPVRSAALLSPCPATEPPFHRSPKSQILILAATLAAAVSQLLSGGLVAPAGRRLEHPAASGQRLAARRSSPAPPARRPRRARGSSTRKGQTSAACRARRASTAAQGRRGQGCRAAQGCRARALAHKAEQEASLRSEPR